MVIAQPGKKNSAGRETTRERPESTQHLNTYAAMKWWYVTYANDDARSPSSTTTQSQQQQRRSGQRNRLNGRDYQSKRVTQVGLIKASTNRVPHRDTQTRLSWSLCPTDSHFIPSPYNSIRRFSTCPWTPPSTVDHATLITTNTMIIEPPKTPQC